MATEQWSTDGLDAGDKVMVYSWPRDLCRPGTVERVTKTRIYLVDEPKWWRRESGTKSIDSWSGTKIVEPTQERVDMLRRQRLISELRRFEWDSKPLSILEAIKKLLCDSQSSGKADAMGSTG